MPRKKSRIFTEVELEFLKIIWDLGEPSPDEIDEVLQKKGRKISPGSLRNVLTIMINKGYITRRKAGNVFRYKAKVQKDEAVRTIISDMISHAFEGSESLVVAALLGNSKISGDEMEKIRKLIECQGKGEEDGHRKNPD